MDQADHFATTPNDVRRSPRFPFFADARITEAETRSNMTARTSELCRHGCYMDMMNPFLLGTPLRIRIVHHGQSLDAAVRVVHSQPNIGMGICFDEMDRAHAGILEGWLSELQAA